MNQTTLLLQLLLQLLMNPFKTRKKKHLISTLNKTKKLFLNTEASLPSGDNGGVFDRGKCDNDDGDNNSNTSA